MSPGIAESSRWKNRHRSVLLFCVHDLIVSAGGEYPISHVRIGIGSASQNVGDRIVKNSGRLSFAADKSVLVAVNADYAVADRFDAGRVRVGTGPLFHDGIESG